MSKKQTKIVNDNTPTVEEIKELRAARETFYSELHNQQKIDDKYFELEYSAGIPTKIGYEQRTPPTAREWVETGVNNYTLDNPRATVAARSNSDSGREKDAKLEKFLNYWLQLIVIQIKQSSTKLLLRGESFCKLSMDDTYFGSYKGKRLEETDGNNPRKRDPFGMGRSSDSRPFHHIDPQFVNTCFRAEG